MNDLFAPTPVGMRFGIPDFLDQDVAGLNKKYMGFYDRIAGLYRLANIVTGPSIKRQAPVMFRPLAPRAGERVLETSVGEGDWFRWFHRVAPGARLYGADLSWGMLRVCQRNLRRWGIR
ncbi:MAG: class I SAM-dependent methyltransferase, partial [Bifidobacteriaceae bacterium]|nr:class I SAM-dependent methyltransferase [Bifidobacteriaceae bacterium]